jgi:hypothetical protein
MTQNETASPPLHPHARPARRLRGRPSGLKGRCRARCATGLRPAFDLGASAALMRKRCRAGPGRSAPPHRAALSLQQSRSIPTNQVSTVHSKITSGGVFEGDPVAERLQLLSQTSGLAARIHGMGIEVVGSPVCSWALNHATLPLLSEPSARWLIVPNATPNSPRFTMITVPVLPRNCGHVPLEE